MYDSESVSGFSRLLDMSAPDRRALLGILALLLADSTVALATPWLAGHFVGGLLGDGRVFGIDLRDFIVIWVLLLLMQAVLRFGNQYLLGNVGERVVARLRVRVYDHLQALPMVWHHERKRAQVLSLLANDVPSISGFVTGTLLGLIPQLVTFVGALVLVYLIKPAVALLILIVMPLFYLGLKFLGRSIRPLARARIDEYSKLFAVAGENLELLPLIKSFTREAGESLRFEEGNRRLVAVSRRYLRAQSMMSPLVRFCAALGVMLLLWLGIGEVRSGELSAADLVSLLLYAMLLTSPLSALANAWGQLQTALGAAERLIAVLSVAPEPDDTGKKTLAEDCGGIRFENLGFRYPGSEPLFENFNLEIGKGETVAITGRNGAGKSTLIQLLARFLEPDQGCILLGDRDIREYSIESLRQRIGLVQQQVLLFNGTLRENLVFARPCVDDDQLLRALESAKALDFIGRLPDGLDTVIGDQGVKLSGGQRQRLALARVLLKDPPILVLDEATAMFDPDGEKSFVAGCRKSLSGKTVILITHRPASLALADRVVELGCS